MTSEPLSEDGERLLARTHRIRTSLAGIAGLAEYVEQSLRFAVDDPLRDALARIHRSAMRAMDDVDQLLVDTPKLAPPAANVEVVDLEALTQEVVDTIVIGGRRIEVRIGSVQVAVDPELFSYILENLVANARDHAAGGSPIVITAHDHIDRVEMVIEDEGPGIPETAREHLFDRGVTGGGSTGHGVGLYLVARFAQRHGGRVWIDDRPGGGTAFHVELPKRVGTNH